MKENILESIGNTPLIKLNKVNDTNSRIYVKLENLNPSGSIKDVMTLYMVKSAEKKGILKPCSRIMEATTGNTGISFAMISAVKGYKFIAVMPENMSIERRKIMQALGAEVILTPAKEDMSGAIKRLAKKEGLLVGISSGANVFAALKIAQKIKGRNTIVTILPDSGGRYLTMM